ncbi:MAG: hypothetical protein ACPG4U_15075 [Pseudomonadales bacterium]
MQEAKKVVFHPWRIAFSALTYYLVTVFALSAMLLYRFSFLPATTQYICGEQVELECLLYVVEQLATSSQWQAQQFLVYLLLTAVLWPFFRRAAGNLLLNLAVVAFIVAGLLSLSVERSGVELYATLLNPLLLALLMLWRRRRKITFNPEAGRVPDSIKTVTKQGEV